MTTGTSEIAFSEDTPLRNAIRFQFGRFAIGTKSLQRMINDDRSVYRKHGFPYPRTTMRIAGKGYLYLFRRVWVQLKEEA